MDNTVGWTIAFVPLALVLVNLLVASSVAAGSFDNAALAVGFSLNTALVIWDRKKLAAAGVKIDLLMGILLVPWYLIERARRVPKTAAIPIIWLCSLLLYLVAPLFLADYLPVTMDTALVESGIASEWADQNAGARPEVTCPDTATVKVGGTFSCDLSATEARGSMYTVAVTVLSGDGTYSWQAF